MDDSAQTLMKGVTSYIMLRRGARSLWTEGPRIRLRFKSVRMGNAGNWNVLVPAGEEINWDAVSKGDWKQHKANWILISNGKKMWFLDTPLYPNLGIQSFLERNTLECDSHVGKTERIWACSRVSYTGYYARIWEASTSNLKYVLSPIEN